MSPRDIDLPDLFDLMPPSAAGSKTSEDAAERVLHSPFRRASWRKIMLTLAALDEPISREALSERIGIPQHVLCARLYELRPLWVEAVSAACISTARVAVDGYKLTPAGRARVIESTEAPGGRHAT